jgi:diguanylate cyclase (GGDEF)-like protein
VNARTPERPQETADGGDVTRTSTAVADAPAPGGEDRDQAAGRATALDRVARLAVTLLDVPSAWASLDTAEGQRLCGSARPPLAVREPGEAAPADLVVAQLMPVDRPLIISDAAVAHQGEQQTLGAGGFQAYAAVPVHGRTGAVLGALCVGDVVPRPWPEREVIILEQLAEVAALELELRVDLESVRERDQLTGLPNAAGCERLIAAAQRRAESCGSAVAVILIDLSNLSLVTDGLGRIAGERFLMEVARRLQRDLRGVAVGHLGAERFVVIGDEPDEHAALALADRVRDVLREPITVGDWPLPLVSCVGIVLGELGDLPAELIDAGVAAVCEAQEAPNDVRGNGGREVRERAAKRLGLDAALRRAVDTDEFTPHFQPLYDLRDGSLSGFEALGRWHSPELGDVSPVEFIPVAEESGLIVMLGRQVLASACRHAAAWPRDADGRAPGVSVNVSPMQLNSALPRYVTDVLRESGLAPGRLTLELTESALVDIGGVGSAVLSDLRALGVHLALDDFGTGFASLHHLANLPLDVVKIDRSFVQRLDEPRTRAIVAATVALARGLELSVTAEGIESEALLREVTDLGFTHGQGFGLGRPADAGVAHALASSAAEASRRSQCG